MYSKQNIAVECLSIRESEHVQYILEENEAYNDWDQKSNTVWNEPLIIFDGGDNTYFDWENKKNLVNCEQTTYKEFIRRFVRSQINLYL